MVNNSDKSIIMEGVLYYLRSENENELKAGEIVGKGKKIDADCLGGKKNMLVVSKSRKKLLYLVLVARKCFLSLIDIWKGKKNLHLKIKKANCSLERRKKGMS